LMGSKELALRLLILSAVPATDWTALTSGTMSIARRTMAIMTSISTRPSLRRSQLDPRSLVMALT
jgi:hypothetical protein